ncbi:CCA tRNA nucleotidyltransferase [Mycolicibacterium brumae]|uniref:CCA tRNA nucleotidyltransferase n=1 Tax=Mycolicibacterium brumae TaxID=85968 RepID=UPI000AFE2B52|nr:CCA tRNA nucleotidyltransferase [Mycolicibacterium brumae]RWA21235.1 poly(A) polymerase [Mycolicibacterium brumae DSM 44177]UWW10694.1 CCA tRNA nucleotidyltransferase [Mycolicibacterium brumae]
MPDTDDTADAELLARAAVALTGHRHVLADLGARFQLAGHELYLVGGTVRDALLGRLGGDLDFTTSARPDEVQRILQPWADAMWDTGIAFGTVGAARHGHQVEITTYRADSYDQVSRNPTVAFGDTLAGDLVRRDFTVNAMAVRITADGPGEFVDPLNGLAALRERVLDTPSAPQVSFGDDPLRMLRAARFVSQLGFALAPRVRTAIEEMAPQLSRITAERIAAELDKLMLGADPAAGIEVMVSTGLGEQILPEVGGMRMAIDEHHQHKDVYQHSLTVLRQAIDLEDDGPDLVLRWAALLHDIGKPATRRHEPGGGVSFHHHEVVGAKLTRKRMRALKYSKQMVDDVSQLVYLHLRFHGYGDGRWTDSAVRRYVTDAGPLLARLHKLVRADCTTRNKRRAARLQATYDELEHRIAELAAKEDLARVRPDLDGNAIMELLGISAGPEVGRAWRHLKELRMERGPLDPDEARAELLDWWNREGSAGV